MIPQIIIKNVDQPPPVWNKKQPRLFEDFLSKVTHLKNEVKEMELKLKNREESYKQLEKQVLTSLNLTDLVKSTSLLQFLETFSENSQNYELQLLENQVQNLEREIRELQLKNSEKNSEIASKTEVLTEFKKEKEKFDEQSLLKLSLKSSVKEMMEEVYQLSKILIERKKLLSPFDDIKVTLSDDSVMLIESVLKNIKNLDSKLSTRRTSLDFIESKIDKIEKLEKDLELSRKTQKKKIREFEEQLTRTNDAHLDEQKAKKSQERKDIEESYQRSLDGLGEEIRRLDSENENLGGKLEELERIALEVNRKEKELNEIKKGWDKLWERKGDYEDELRLTSDRMENLPVLNRKKKVRKSVFK